MLDFTRVLSGPYCTALLADLGAEVERVGARLAELQLEWDEGAMWDFHVERGRRRIDEALQRSSNRKAVAR